MNLAVTICAVLAIGAYVCRMDQLQWRKHRAGTVLVHFAGGIAALVAGDNAINGQAGLSDIALLALSWAWLLISLKMWRFGPPDNSKLKVSGQSESHNQWPWQARG